MVTSVALVAVTVNRDGFPATTVVGLAVISTVAIGLAATVTVAVAVVVPPDPTAVTVYVVVTVGLTVSRPPPAVGKVNEVPSLPLTVTVVAYDEVTVRVDELPDVIELGLAVIETVGAGFAETVTIVEAVVLAVPLIAVAV